ncbi:hypothetical protein SAMN05421788_101842 [Filimonas lacunae]|uniref:Uncharacterized protein n=1 Tax=Filimonas lacunae TaxID=477680 RepID=A0A173MPJ2_9BACT|nr:hypothetical protein [Filimonas lacunae]BAV09406.1 hypothetical protein FLA_5454 [Filimonas lacunae]SIS72562.1 hypothetical protein SAMN05421788_101842 [Filimonas lacunae]
MATKTIDQLKALFKNGDKPNQQAFYDFMESYRHVSSKIAVSDLTAELYSVISSMPPANAYEQLLSMVQGKASPADILSAIAAARGTTIAPVENGKIPTAYLPDLSASVSVTDAFTTNVTVGGIPSGTLIEKGRSLIDIIESMLTTTYYPTITEPSFSLGNDAGSLRKIGASLNVTLTFNFNQGSIQNGWNSTLQGNRAGAAIDYTFIKADNSSYANQPQAGKTYTVNAHAVIQGVNIFKAQVNYAAGPQPLDSDGNNYNTALPAAKSPVVSTSFEGVYPILATTTAITTATEQALVSMLTGNNIEVNLIAESTGNKQSIWIPTVWVTSRPLQSIQYFNTVSNAYDSTNKVSDFAITDVTIDGIAYKKYTNQTSDRGSLKVKLILTS